MQYIIIDTYLILPSLVAEVGVVVDVAVDVLVVNVEVEVVAIVVVVPEIIIQQ